MKWRHLLPYVVASVRGFSRDNCGQLSAAISYYVLFSIVPLTVFLLSIFGIVIKDENLRTKVSNDVVDFIDLRQGEPILVMDTEAVGRRFGAEAVPEIEAALANMDLAVRNQVAADLNLDRSVEVADRLLRPGELSVRYENSVSNTLRAVSDASGPLTIVGLLAMGWSALAMFGSVRRSLNAVWRVEYQRPFLFQKLADLTMVAFLGVLLLASVVGTGALRALRDVSTDALGPLSSETGYLWSLPAYIVPALASFLTFALLYRYVPAADVHWRHVIVPAAVAALLFEILKNGFAFYVENFKSYDALYGSLGGILLFLTGTYLTAVILLLGAEMSVQMEPLLRGQFATRPSGPKRPFVEKAKVAATGFLKGLVVASPRRSSSDSSESPPARGDGRMGR